MRSLFGERMTSSNRLLWSVFWPHKSTFSFLTPAKTYGRREPDRQVRKMLGYAVTGTSASPAAKTGAVPGRPARGAVRIPSSRQSADTEVSRCAIAAWASRT